MEIGERGGGINLCDGLQGMASIASKDASQGLTMNPITFSNLDVIVTDLLLQLQNTAQCI